MFNLLAPFLRLSFDFSKTALVISLSAVVRPPARAEPAKSDYKEAIFISSRNVISKQIF